MNLPTTSFWEFSNNIYHKPGVERALLDLQQRFGLDVNIVLLGCWAARYRHLRLVGGGLAALVSGVSTWQAEVVRVLRRLRNRLKGAVGELTRADVQGLRDKVLEVEVHAEHIEQNHLEHELVRHATPIQPSEIKQCVADNVAAYFRLQAIDFDQETNSLVGTLIGAVFDISAEEAQALWINALKGGR